MRGGGMVQVRGHRGRLHTGAGDVLVVPMAEGAPRAALARVDRRLADALAARLRRAGFRARADELFVHHGDTPVVLAGLGPAPVQPEAWRRAGARSRQEAERQRAGRVMLQAGVGAPDDMVAFAEGFLLAGYRFARYTSDERGRRTVRALTLAHQALEPAQLRPRLAALEAMVVEVFRARDLVNEPASVKTPGFLGEQAQHLAGEVPGLSAVVWGPTEIAAEGLTGLVAVARGTREEPRFIQLHWAGPGARQRIALIGKAITFDSGGLSLKPAKSMETMKYDMAGGAAVLGAVAAAARLRLPVDVTAYVPATENLPGGGAQKPGDVIRYSNGTTVEVLNTDAEGRLVLADALVLASRTRPDAIIDLATLTGAARIALGTLVAGVMGNDQPLVDRLLAAGQAAGEPLWQLPLVREYRDDLKSPIADLKNVSSSGEAGSIIAGLFLQEFVGSSAWAHLDIAGPAFADKDLPHAPRGGTGFGVRLLVRYLSDLDAGAPAKRAPTKRSASSRVRTSPSS